MNMQMIDHNPVTFLDRGMPEIVIHLPGGTARILAGADLAYDDGRDITVAEWALAWIHERTITPEALAVAGHPLRHDLRVATAEHAQLSAALAIISREGEELFSSAPNAIDGVAVAVWEDIARRRSEALDRERAISASIYKDAETAWRRVNGR